MRCTPTIGLLMISMATHAVDFKKDIPPLLKNKCSRCHSGYESKGGLSLNTRADILTGDGARKGEHEPNVAESQRQRSR